MATVLFANDFDGGTDGAVITASGSGGSSGDAFSQVGSLAPTYSAEQAHSGGLSAHWMFSGTGAAALWFDDATGSATSYARFYLRHSGAPYGSEVRLLTFSGYNDSGYCGILHLLTDGTLGYSDGSSGTLQPASPSATPLPLGQWVRVEVQLVVGTSARVQTWLDPDSAGYSDWDYSVISTSTDSATCGEWRFGVRADNTATIECWMDDLAVAYDDWIGPSIVPPPSFSGSATFDLPLALQFTGTRSQSGEFTVNLPLALAFDGSRPITPPPVNTQPAIPEPPPLPPPIPQYRLALAETVTGKVIVDLPFVGTPSWQREINASGKLSGVGVRLWPRLERDTLTALDSDWRYTLLWCRGEQILQAGMLVGEDADDSDWTTSLSTVTLWDFFTKKRLVEYPGKEITAADADVIFSATSPDPRNQNLSWGSVARRLVEISITGDPTLVLPIALPEPASGDAVITYAASDVGYIGQALTDLTKRENGPEIEFVPEWRDDGHQYFQWRMRIADGRLGQLGYPYVYDYGRALQSLKVTRDGTGMTFYVFAKGKDDRTDSGGSLTWNYSSTVVEKTSQGWPFLWTADTGHTSLDDRDALLAYANADVLAGENAAYTGNAALRFDGRWKGQNTGSPDASVLQTGDTLWCQITTDIDSGLPGHPRLPDGKYAVRLLALGSGSDLDTAQADLQVLGKVG